MGRYFRGGDFPLFPRDIEYGDIVRGLPVSAESCKAIYCSHVLEHLALDDFRVAIRNTHSYLKKNGVFRLVLPDLERLARDYLNSDDPTASITFMEESLLGMKTRPRHLYEFLRQWLGNSSHLWMWDLKSLTVELRQAGFGEFRRAEFGDSAEPRFSDVEDPGRWKDCVGIECTK